MPNFLTLVLKRQKFIQLVFKIQNYYNLTLVLKTQNFNIRGEEKMRVFARAKAKVVRRQNMKYVQYVIRCHHVDFQPTRRTLGRLTPNPPKNLIKSPSLKMVVAPPAPDGPPPKYYLRLVYVRRCHHIDFQTNRTTLGRPTPSPRKNPHFFLPPYIWVLMVTKYKKKDFPI